MKRVLLSWAAAMAVTGVMTGGVQAQSTPDTGTLPSSSPSTTPNDGTATPLKGPVPPGQIPPAGETEPSHRYQDDTRMPSSTDSATDQGQMGAPGSKTGMPLDQNQVPNRHVPGTTDPKPASSTGGK